VRPYLIYFLCLREEFVQTFNGIDSKFRLAILVARRAKQLIGGARRRVDIKSENPLSVAMEEFRQGKIDFDVLNEEENLFAQASENLEGAAATTGTVPAEEEGEGGADLGAEETGEEAEADSES
jgi:DNA-directed RNA polymerase subunit omega